MDQEQVPVRDRTGDAAGVRIRLDSFDVGAMLTPVLRAVVSFVIAAPIALVLLRPILRLRA